jgi:hypothetical protein
MTHRIAIALPAAFDALSYVVSIITLGTITSTAVSG